MKISANKPIQSLRKPEASLVAMACLLAASVTYADSVTLSETQTDGIKCSGSPKECVQVTSGNYSITAKLSARTFSDQGIVLADITESTLLGIQIGNLQFSSDLSSADPGKGVIKTNSLSGIWTTSHERCTKSDVDGNCTKSKIVIDNSVKVKANNNGATINVSGKWDNSDPDYTDQTVYNQFCQDNGSGQFSEEASISIGDILISHPITINCTVTPRSKSDSQGNTYDLINLKIRAKLAPTP